MDNKVGNRWLILIASMICNLVVGAGYTWSLYQTPLIKMYGWTSSQTSLTFTLTIVMMPISMIIAGGLLNKLGSKRMLMVGGTLWGLGIFLAGFATSLGYLYFVYGIVAGLGVGVVYSAAITTTVQWFPDKRGLANGLIAGGLGLGSVVFAPVVNMFIQSQGVLATFKIIGLIYLAIIIIAAFFVKQPPAGYMPDGYVPDTAAVGVSPVDKNWKQMLSDPMFYILWVMYVCGGVAGLMIISNAAPIGMEKIQLTPALAAIAVSILSLGNTGGRVFWGWISDKIGRYWAICGIYLFSAAAMFFLTTVSSYSLFIATLIIIGLCYGGLLGIYPSVTADMFGAKNVGTNYGIMFSGTSMAAFIGPQVAGAVKQSSGGAYDTAFIIAAVLGLVGLVLTLFVMQQLKKRQANIVAIQGAK